MTANLRIALSALTLLASTMVSAQAEQTLNVVVSIAPIHALVAGVMEGVGEPELLLPGGASPHSYALKPSDARALNKAAIVVRVSDQLENFLTRPIASLASKARILTLAEVKGMTLYEPREGGLWEKHGHDDEHDHSTEKHDEHAHAEKHEDHEEHEYDPHIWLDPQNAKRIVNAVAATLRKAYPEHVKTFTANAQKLNLKLDKLDRDLFAATKPLQGKPYILFHDATRYFDSRYKLNPVGAISVSPDRPAGARRLREIRTRIKDQGVVCVFAEPQFQPKLVQTLISGTSAQAGSLDPIGAGIQPGPELYFKLMRNLATSMAGCLKNSS